MAKSKAPAKKKSPSREEPKSGVPTEKAPHLPIVGIGASAGGLEALEEFLLGVPAQSGMAFVIVQHLDPTHKGILAEMLQRVTSMPVAQVKDRVKVEADHVYVIPPNRDLALLRGRLILSEPISPRGFRLPIDYFFKSLADDCQERAIGVVLSGMGSDGTVGLRAIKQKSGLTVVQEPATAKFNAMPLNAIDAGLADLVAPAQELPGKILSYLRHTVILKQPQQILDSKTRSGLDKVLLLLRTATGHDFFLYKKSTLYRRINRRMGIHQLDRIAVYVRYLQENPVEAELLCKELLIGVTDFFRDPETWEFLKTEALSQLLANRPTGGALRAWVAGCSTGEEAYSLAILFREAIEAFHPKEPCTLQVFATDLDREAVETARQGLFPASIATTMSAQRLERYFVPEGGGYRVAAAIREMVLFAVHNVISDPPFIKLDLLCCRNLLIYLEPELQENLLQRFHYSLNPGAILFLGSAESVGGRTDLFETLVGKARLFRKRDSLRPMQLMSLHPSPHEAAPASVKPATPTNLEALADKVILQRYSPAAVLVSAEGDLLYASARTGKYLEPAVGKANLNVFAMIRGGLRPALTSALQGVRQDGGIVTLRGLKVGANRAEHYVDLTVEALQEPKGLKGKFLLVFTNAASPVAEPPLKKGAHKAPAENARKAELQQQLQWAREELRTNREEMQSSQEELKSANEELQSTNEELQSTNEELTTSREEMQSMNEELQTLNAELSSKLEELSRQSDDMRNLLDSTEIATVFLDAKLCVRSFTDRATEIIKLIPGDVGRPFTDLRSALIYQELAEDAREVLRTLVFSEKDVATGDRRWFRVRIMPYRTLQDRIDGVVMTFIDITTLKNMEAQMRQT